MIQVIAGVLGVIVIVLQALWKNRQRAKELENDPVEDVLEHPEKDAPIDHKVFSPRTD